MTQRVATGATSTLQRSDGPARTFCDRDLPHPRGDAAHRGGRDTPRAQRSGRRVQCRARRAGFHGIRVHLRRGQRGRAADVLQWTRVARGSRPSCRRSPRPSGGAGGASSAIGRAWRSSSCAWPPTNCSELHDLATGPTRRLLGISSGPLYFAWVIPMTLLLVLFVVAYARFLMTLPRTTPRAFLTGRRHLRRRSAGHGDRGQRLHSRRMATT